MGVDREARSVGDVEVDEAACARASSESRRQSLAEEPMPIDTCGPQNNAIRK
jgi:hypothetical protein